MHCAVCLGRLDDVGKGIAAVKLENASFDLVLLIQLSRPRMRNAQKQEVG